MPTFLYRNKNSPYLFFLCIIFSHNYDHLEFFEFSGNYCEVLNRRFLQIIRITQVLLSQSQQTGNFRGGVQKWSGVQRSGIFASCLIS